MLHLTGLPLASSQGDLTPLQTAFLYYAIPKAMKQMNGITDNQQEQGPMNRDELKAELKAKAKARKEGRL